MGNSRYDDFINRVDMIEQYVAGNVDDPEAEYDFSPEYWAERLSEEEMEFIFGDLTEEELLDEGGYE
jgi:hypothetical protein